MQTTTLEVSGMMCEACVGHVTRALQGVAGVHGATVDLAVGRAQVQHDDAATSDLVAAVEEEGYEAHAI